MALNDLLSLTLEKLQRLSDNEEETEVEARENLCNGIRAYLNRKYIADKDKTENEEDKDSLYDKAESKLNESEKSEKKDTTSRVYSETGENNENQEIERKVRAKGLRVGEASPKTNKVQISKDGAVPERIQRLAAPRQVFYENPDKLFQIPKAALQYRASHRIRKLAKPVQRDESKPHEDNVFKVKKSALRARCTQRLSELAKPARSFSPPLPIFHFPETRMAALNSVKVNKVKQSKPLKQPATIKAF